MIDICQDYCKQFDICFNPLKSQTACFGGSPPSHCSLVLNGMAIPITEKIKYLGVYSNSKTNSTDTAVAFRIFFGSFNNIMSVLGTARDEMLAVGLHLVKHTACQCYYMAVKHGHCHPVINTS